MGVKCSYERTRRFMRAQSPAPGSDGSWGSVEPTGEHARDLVIADEPNDTDQRQPAADDGEAADPEGMTGRGTTAGMATAFILIGWHRMLVLDVV